MADADRDDGSQDDESPDGGSPEASPHDTDPRGSEPTDVDYTGLESASAGRRFEVIAACIGLAVVGFLVAIAVVLSGVSVLEALGISIRDRPVAFYPTATVLQGLGFGLAVGGYVAATRRTDLIRARVPSIRDIAWAVAGVVALFGVLVLVSAIISELGAETAQNRITQVGSENPAVMLYMIPLAFLVIGPGEELLFRGAIQGLLRGVYAPGPAVVIASALFAVAHFQALLGSSTNAKAVTIGALFVLSLVLGVVYEFTDNLVVPALVHGAYDAVIFVAIYAQATGPGP